jgi:hypothetical protein
MVMFSAPRHMTKLVPVGCGGTYTFADAYH